MIALILAGGSGTRLWPLSRALYSKQFISFNSKLSMLQHTVKGAAQHCEDVVIVAGESQYFLVKHQLQGFGVSEENILKEPFGRNTAPAIAFGCKFILEKYGDTEVLVMPSDHIISEGFFDTVKKAERLCNKHICTFGIPPTHPSTGYGYIRVGEKKGDGYLVKGFYEKPSREKATEYLRGGGFLWNSGIFLFNIKRMLKEYKTHLPSIHRHLSSTNELLKEYANLPDISIDYGVMEKTDDMMVFPFKEGWTDVGSWESVYGLLEKDNDGNAKKGDVLSLDTQNSLIMGEERLIATIGVRDLAIVDTKDALLVAPRDRSEEVKKIVESLKEKGRSETSLHSTVYRPWGYYTVLESGHRYKVKRLALYPGKSISNQLHHHRAEHWIVVKGTARIIRDGKVILIHENESIYVPKSTRHRVENPGKVDLHIIEIQTGEYVEEDDIVRFD